MRYSEMTAVQRHALLDNPDYYPFRVVFLGKAAILAAEEIDFLRQHGVDFDIDQTQAERLLSEAAEKDVAVLWSGPLEEPHEKVESTSGSTGGLLAWTVAALAAVYGLLRLARRYLQGK